MKFARTAIAFTIMAISADAFSREKTLEHSQAGGGRYLKRTLAGMTTATGSAATPVAPVAAPVATMAPVISGSVAAPVAAPVAPPTLIASASVDTPIAAPVAPPTPIASASTPISGSLSAVTGGGDGGDGDGEGNVPTTSPPPPTAEACRTIPIFFLKSELTANYTRYATGGGFDSVPYYNANTGEQYGFYSDEATNLDSGDCVGGGVFSFGPTISYLDQITFSFSCYGASNSITGGNGRFGCASGYEIFNADEVDRISSTLYLCGTLCPYTGPMDPVATTPRTETP
ncbi:hypothetical protein MPSEU_000559900 [Mayamaea pseudoterrestris]|nr:hypothetical protein MPSEU_000559900 [Mayamaea pseudoterrestris]